MGIIAIKSVRMVETGVSSFGIGAPFVVINFVGGWDGMGWGVAWGG